MARKLAAPAPVASIPSVTFSDAEKPAAPVKATRKKAAPAANTVTPKAVETVPAASVPAATPVKAAKKATAAASPAVITAAINASEVSAPALRRFAADTGLEVGSRGKIASRVCNAFAALLPAEQQKYLTA